MSRIVSSILFLQQHIDTLSRTPEIYRPVRCSHCGLKSPWRHGCYSRKADRDSHSLLNPVPIPRFFCSGCHLTCSRLPACIPPRRWYDWAIQQQILLLLLTGFSLYAVSQLARPCRDTCRRWWRWLAGRSISFESALRSAFPELGRTADGSGLWRLCLNSMGLRYAMAWLDGHGVSVP